VQTIRLNSSLRARPVAETLRHARTLAAQLGIVRVTDTTRLDRAGVPVFAAIRPNAIVGSLCVHAGKGMLPEEAEVGAYMEAIEFALAEPQRAKLPMQKRSGRELAAAGYPLIDFLPRGNVELDEERRIDCVEAEELTRGERVWVPAERVLFPCPTTFFTSDTNGLASGNTLLEATAHGLAEVIERDVTSFLPFHRTSQRIRNESLPDGLAKVAARVEPQGFDLIVRAVDNEFQLPFFSAVVREQRTADAVHTGYGCHAWSAIAATRAVCEAFQCRLTVIHGGRDSLIKFRDAFAKMTNTERYAVKHLFADANAAGAAPGDFGGVVDWSARATTIESVYALLLERARAVGGSVLRVALTPPDAPIQVVKVIVPKLEFYAADRPFGGPRLKKAQLSAQSA
jgi:ribosomal protein S12 methylthiotransferase accessory factor